MDPIDTQTISDIAAQRLGAPPQPPAAPPRPADAPPTQNEQVQDATAPATEASQQAAEPVTYIVDFGNGQKRELTASQIAGTAKRYADLNYRHQTEVAPYQDVLGIAHEIAAAMKQSGQDVSGKDIADYLRAAAKAFSKNPVEGAAADRQPTPAAPNANDPEAMFKKWEEDNAASLPPGYRENMNAIQSIQQNQIELANLLKGVLQGQAGVTAAAGSQLNAAKNTQASALQQQAAANLNAAQQKLGLPDSAEQDFYNFAFSRGYTFEDFIDPKLTMAVVTDFKNNMASPEMDRLRHVAQRRQAFTGAVDGAPGTSGVTPQANPDQDLIGAVTNQIYDRRNIGR
jgi:hypothetical protein